MSRRDLVPCSCLAPALILVGTADGDRGNLVENRWRPRGPGHVTRTTCVLARFIGSVATGSD